MIKNQRFLISALVASFVLVLAIATPQTMSFTINEATTTPPTEPSPLATPDVDVQALMDEAVLHLRNENPVAAIEVLDVVLMVEPHHADAYLARGLAYNQLGELDAALVDLTSVITLRPWQAAVYLYRASVYMADDNFAAALLDLNEGILIDPFDLRLLSNRAEVYYELGDSAASDIDVTILHALRFAAVGDRAAAIDELRDVAASSGESPMMALVHYMIGALYERQNDLDAVIAAYTASVASDPYFTLSYLGRGDALLAKGDEAGAGADFASRINLMGADFRDADMVLGEMRLFEMAYQRVYRIHFVARAGDVITLRAEDHDPAAPIDPLMALLRPDGAAISGDDDAGYHFNARIDSIQLPADGTYTLLVSHAEGGRDIGFAGTIEVSIVLVVDV